MTLPASDKAILRHPDSPCREQQTPSRAKEAEATPTPTPPAKTTGTDASTAAASPSPDATAAPAPISPSSSGTEKLNVAIARWTWLPSNAPDSSNRGGGNRGKSPGEEEPRHEGHELDQKPTTISFILCARGVGLLLTLSGLLINSALSFQQIFAGIKGQVISQ